MLSHEDKCQVLRSRLSGLVAMCFVLSMSS